MEYYVALAPEFSISPAEFAAAWNATDAARQLAEARVDATAPQGFPLDPAMLQQGALICCCAGKRLLLDHRGKRLLHPWSLLRRSG